MENRKQIVKGVKHVGDTYYPNDVQEVIEIVDHARANNLQVRVIGAGLSFPSAIYDAENKNQIKVVLSGKLKQIQVIELAKSEETNDFAIVKVGGGCNFGVNPNDKNSNLENSFNYQIDRLGYAFPMLGGSSYPTIGGFMQTGCSASSSQYTMADFVESIEFVTGTSEVLTVRKEDEDLFNAVLVSLGLYGIITAVTFKLPKRFLVEGLSSNKKLVDSALASDELNQYKKMEKFLFENEYAHIDFFPQSGVKLVTEWSAHKTNFDNPKKPFKHPLSLKPVALLAKFVLWSQSSFLIKQFASPVETQTYCENWDTGISIDDKADNDFLKNLSYSELWIPREHIDQFMIKLNQLIAKNKNAEGNFVMEFHAVKKSPAWLSPAYDHDVLRVELIWWNNGKNNPENYFALFWEAMKDIPKLRFHWGKCFPIPGKKYGDFSITTEELFASFPKFRDWLTFREEMDPQQLFVTDYWRKIFSIPTLDKQLISTNAKQSITPYSDRQTQMLFNSYLETETQQKKIAECPEENFETIDLNCNR